MVFYFKSSQCEAQLFIKLLKIMYTQYATKINTLAKIKLSIKKNVKVAALVAWERICTGKNS